MREAQHFEAQSEMRVRDLGAVKRGSGGVRRAIIGENDLPLDPAVAKELGASPETLLDATRLVICR
jgi:hypothetical protein